MSASAGKRPAQNVERPGIGILNCCLNDRQQVRVFVGTRSRIRDHERLDPRRKGCQQWPEKDLRAVKPQARVPGLLWVSPFSRVSKPQFGLRSSDRRLAANTLAKQKARGPRLWRKG
jgi:hypothetical protein